jgi:hypothetical protein
MGVSCRSNVPHEIPLKPGEAYERTVSMLVRESDEGHVQLFKMGFTPLNDDKTYWSNEVVVFIAEKDGEPSDAADSR